MSNGGYGFHGCYGMEFYAAIVCVKTQVTIASEFQGCAGSLGMLRRWILRPCLQMCLSSGREDTSVAVEGCVRVCDGITACRMGV